MTAILERVLPHPLDVAKHYLTEHRGCQNCQCPVNDQGTGSWVHTLTGTYRCTPGAAVSVGGDGFAMPYSPEADEEALQQAFEQGHEEGRDEALEQDCDQCPEERENGAEDGRKAMRDDLAAAFDAAIAEVGDNASADELRGALARAWEATPA